MNTPPPSARPARHDGLEQRTLARARSLAPSVRRVLVGFSGGSDSLALAATLARIAPVARLAVTLCHVDHGLRPESGTEADACVGLARSLGLPIVAPRVEPSPTIAHPGVGVEEAARRMRYVALAAARLETGADLVALAHHEDDQAETVLLHLLRGAGLAGASGMAEHSTIVIPWWEVDQAVDRTSLLLWRPFLAEPRSVVRDYAARLGLAPVMDPSNDDHSLRRNAVRLEVLPALRALFPGATGALARYANIAAEEDNLLDRLANEGAIAARSADGALAVALIREAPRPLARRVAYRWLYDRGRPNVTFDQVEAVIELARRPKVERVIEVGGDDRVVIDGDHLRVGRLAELQEAMAQARGLPLWPRDLPTTGVRLPARGVVRLGALRITVGGETEEPAIERSGRARRLPARLLAGGVEARRLGAGERWVSGGKVRDWLRRLGAPAIARDRLVCLATREGVLWVLGAPPRPRDAAQCGEPTVVVSFSEVEEWS